MRLRIDLAYDGAGFHGWATQPGLRTVQETVELALATVLRVPSVAMTCAGRTDAGVHARGQVAHVDVPELPTQQARTPNSTGTGSQLNGLERRLNGVLPADVRVRRVVAAPAGFDARFSAVWRRYAYRIADRAETVDPLTRGHVLGWPRPLDDLAMNDAAVALLGEHDFAAFCKRREGATTIRTLHVLSWTRDEAGLLVGTVRADAFCHHMVRSLVGGLVAVGEGRREPGWIGEVLRAGVRDPAVNVVAAHGLTLEEVGYPPDAELAARAEASRTLRVLPSSSPGQD
ncbi:tRNA pseudouridine(38-40) synthase TruA [Nocardioides terrisoli]|uniref:tRNA pseudouridine(38-40) synthase TruA n=1 Tax=Nocardioides terrisoli TaxID=3388267 RepID=UPI00287B6A0A|nr:tRNA pseudouridine(38-40) synthase TruA [Nocardioides marmorisolisilvae]